MSGLGAVPFEMDAWGVDIVITGSQKAWMAAPGLAMVAASDRAWAAMESAHDAALLPRPPTPTATPTPRARRPGPRRSRSSSRSTRASSSWSARARPRSSPATRPAPRRRGPASTALGFELFADQRFASRTVTAARLPEGLDWKAFNDGVRRRGVILAGGQGKIAGHVFRLGHLGSVTLGEMLDAIGVIEEVSLEHDRPVEAGAAVAAAQRAALEVMGALAPVGA